MSKPKCFSKNCARIYKCVCEALNHSRCVSVYGIRNSRNSFNLKVLFTCFSVDSHSISFNFHLDGTISSFVINFIWICVLGYVESVENQSANTKKKQKERKRNKTAIYTFVGSCNIFHYNFLKMIACIDNIENVKTRKTVNICNQLKETNSLVKKKHWNSVKRNQK